MNDRLQHKVLLYRLQTKKDADSFAQLYDSYVARIYRFVFFKVKTHEEAEDIVAEVFLKTWRYVLEHDSIRNFNALLYRVARNAVIDHYKAKQRQGNDVPLYNDGGEELQVADTRQQQILLDQTADMQRHLDQLKDEYRELITMRYLDELSIGDIAEIMGKSEVNVRVTTHRALKALKRIMEKTS